MATHKEALERAKAAIAHLDEAGVMSAKDTSALLSELLAALAAAEARATRVEERIAEMDAALKPFCFDGMTWLHGNKVAITVATADIERARAIRTRGEV